MCATITADTNLKLTMDHIFEICGALILDNVKFLLLIAVSQCQVLLQMMNEANQKRLPGWIRTHPLQYLSLTLDHLSHGYYCLNQLKLEHCCLNSFSA